MTQSITLFGNTVQATAANVRFCSTVLAVDTAKSLAYGDGFGTGSPFHATNQIFFYITRINGRRANVKMYETAAVDTATETEQMTQFGPTMTVGVVDLLNPLKRWVPLTASRYLTFVSDKPVVVEGYSVEITTA